jgi:hypothetical protein
MIITLVFEKSAIFFRRKLSKIAEHCDHNIDLRVTRLGEFSPIGRLFTLALFEITFLCHIFATFFDTKTVVNLVILINYGLGYILGDFFKKASGRPDWDKSKRLLRD